MMILPPHLSGSILVRDATASMTTLVPRAVATDYGQTREILVGVAQTAVTLDGKIDAGEYDKDATDNLYDIYFGPTPDAEAHLYLILNSQ